MKNLDNIEAKNFIEEVVISDLKSGKVDHIVTRFPPEPNGYLHIGHAKALYVDFGLAAKFGGICNLRFDDTNPVKEDVEYIEAIKEDIAWLGFKWDNLFFASDYFGKMYDCAEKLIREGKAFVCDLTADEIRSTRGTLTEPGKESPYRGRTVEENLELFRGMRAGKYKDGERVLRAKIDMASPNMNMRDPVIYRILHATHHRTGDEWCIYPMYDFAHPLEDAFEGVTHSACTLEFEDHRPFYDWTVENVGFDLPPHQYEFARLNLTRTIMSKRYLKRLVDEGAVDGWDDPRMPTLAGMRRRGYPPEAILDFCDRIGVAKANSEVELGLLEHCVRENLNANAKRVMAVLRPVKLTLTNYPEGKTETVRLDNNPNDPDAGTSSVLFSRNLFIEEEDFSLAPPPKYFRLQKGGMVRLKGAYIIKCNDVVTDKDGRVEEILCEYIPDTFSGSDESDIKVKGVLHWVSAADAADITVNLYEPLLDDDDKSGKDFSERLNPASRETLTGKASFGVADAERGERMQFIRNGYFCRDIKSDGKVFNRIVSLKDSFKP